MKRQWYLLCAALLSVFAAKANPGDTTWVQATNRPFDRGNGYGNYDTTVQFPSGATSYRKIYMVFTMGEYACPAGTQYCHQWDYTILNYLMTPGGDTIELGRFISPFATAGTPGFPSTWSHRYTFDVTDYYPLLKNAATFRVFYSGYSAGFTGNVRFAFVEGTPERNVIAIKRTWTGSYNYGNPADPIDNHITAKSLTAPAGTQSAELKYIITGHGSDNLQQCCEFDSHKYYVKVNGNQVDQHTIWRDNCGANELYPQGGTWIFNRGGWCPGAIVEVNQHKLTGVTASNNYTVDVDFDAYTNTAGTNWGSYTNEGAVFYYGNYNHTLDASLETIVAPNVSEEYFRENPSAQPIVRIRNSGSATITSMTIKYGVKDSASATYSWTGSIAPLQTTEIVLPVVNAITNMSLGTKTGSFPFEAQIMSVNGQSDNDATNDTARSSFIVAPTWPTTFVIAMKTNNAGTDGVGQGASETSWQITDMNNNVIMSRTNASLSTQYNDTVNIGRAGFYKLTVTDAGCDGLHWWVWDQNPSVGITAGTFVVRQATSTASIPLHGNTYASTSATYHDDFGCGFMQYFSVKGWPAGVAPISAATASMDAFPNPAYNTLNITLSGIPQVNGHMAILDATGRTILQLPVYNAHLQVNTSGIPSGIYNVIYTDIAGVRASSRITIAK